MVMRKIASNNAFSSDYISDLLWRHTSFKNPKSVSYLPINTIERIVGMRVSDYQSLISKAGNQSVVFESGRCFVGSGAVYAFNEENLSAALKENAALLSEIDWPRNPRLFVEKVAAEWYEKEHPIRPLINQVFGEIFDG